MDTSIHSLQTLFCQLGLADDEEHINTFIEKHSPLPFVNGQQNWAIFGH